MPIYQRRGLRQRLGLEFVRDSIVGATSGSWGTQAGSFNILDSSQADPTASGEALYFRHWLRLLGSAGFIQDLRIASFNTGSGAYVGAQTLATTIFSGMPYETSSLISPAEKDRAIDAVIQDLRIKQETPIWAIDNGHVYSLGPEILDVVDLRYFSDPTDSLSLGEHKMSWWKLETTATGNQLRVSPSLPASYQLILDAIITVSLGAGDLATVNLLSDEIVMFGAAARAFWLAEQRSPGQEAKIYTERRKEAAREFTRLAARFQPKVTRKLQLDEVW